MLSRYAKSYDVSLIIIIILISLFGLVMVYSSSMVIATTDKYEAASDFFYQKQKLNLIASFFVFMLVALIPYKIYKHKYILISIFIVSLSVLFLLGIVGHTTNNAQSWFKLGGRSLQPSEFIKVGMIIYLSAVYAKKQSYINNFNVGVLPPIVFLFFICFLIAIQPDIGTAAIMGLIGMAIVISSGMSFKSIMKFIGILALLGLLASPFIYINRDDIFSDNRLGRIDSFINPFEYEEDEGYQIVNSYIAIGTGGLTGVGLGNSVLKYGYLPEAHTDFIMAIVSEELGLAGVLFVFFCLGFIILKGFWIASRCKDAFGSLLAMGISSMIGIQSFINLGGLSGIIPITGVTLPFISYGGSSILVLAISMGILVNVSMFTNYENRYKITNQQQSEKSEISSSAKSFHLN